MTLGQSQYIKYWLFYYKVLYIWDMDNEHFDKVFWFICGMCISVILFDVAVIFVPVPNAGQKYADILVGSLNTGAFMTGIQYLLGGNPAKKQSTVTTTADTTNVNVGK